MASNRTQIIDPNKFGSSPFNNTPVSLDDLTIFVELTTSKKGRTILSTNNGGSTSINTPDINVNFIEGKYFEIKFINI